MDLTQLRKDIDEIDRQLVELYEQRMDICTRVAEYKIENHKPVFDKLRETEKLQKVCGLARKEENRKGVEELFTQLMSLSRKLQYGILLEHEKNDMFSFTICKELVDEHTKVIFQGAEGAYSQLAMEQFFGREIDCDHVDTFREAIKTCEHIMNHPEQGARIMGLHLEGNYLNMAMKGGQDPNYIYPPDPQEYKELLNSTQCVKRWSAAPELDGALEFGKYASAHGVLVSLAHTTADYLQVKKAYEAGFTHATHFYNAMTSVHKDREYKHEGTVEGIYLMKDMTVEVVADGIHVPPAILKLVYQIKGVERTSLITDAMAAAACDNGTEHFPDSRVIIEEGVCKLADRSAIAGSIATGIRLIRTLVEKAEIPLHDAVRMASESPARLMGLLDRKGTLEKGKDADIIIFNNDIEIQETFIEGKRLSKE